MHSYSFDTNAQVAKQLWILKTMLFGLYEQFSYKYSFLREFIFLSLAFYLYLSLIFMRLLI